MKKIVLPEKMDKIIGLTLLAELRENVDQEIRLDGASVKGIGVHCAQIILAAAFHWREKERELILHCSDSMRRDLSNMGLEAELKIEENASDC